MKRTTVIYNISMMKKFFVKVGTWLRSIVTTMMGEEGRVKREEVKDTQSVYVDVNVNDNYHPDGNS